MHMAINAPHRLPPLNVFRRDKEAQKTGRFASAFRFEMRLKFLVHQILSKVI
ncbi:hypothetical protein RGR602_PC01233 (plasmid) [Rhizobium gallicum bv. gallicum R602sp]|uniref:Uncharacterized protein n=1 Tax=Rhizobium gallicum bv. gallicum R602sp TaxID=1041138 RepID=A0A0B4XDV6_9HYPH|nr:hypothetical protein RGR602_PC01233 [Rhizobium gallicum bv. gallicum R602sp]